jgi:fructose-bisphosphate aldolase class II
MPAVNLNDVLEPALSVHYAVAGLVVLGWEDAVAFVAAAEELGQPVILQAGPGCRRHTPLTVLGKMFRYLADNASVPVVCHVDHARSLEECQTGIDHGFTSVMFDGSDLPLAANIDMTSAVVEIAHPAGVSVEGEIGVVGYSEDSKKDFDPAISQSTNPDEAAKLCVDSGLDALAISIGNVHLQTDSKSEIDRKTLALIEDAVTSKLQLIGADRQSIPLVLHGGSGIPSAVRTDLARSTAICKFNIGTELRQQFGVALRQTLTDDPDKFDRIAILGSVMPSMQKAAMDIIAEFGTP